VYIWVLFGLELGWEKASRKKVKKMLFSGRQMPRQTLGFGVGRVYRVQMEESAMNAATVPGATFDVKTSSRLSNQRRNRLEATDASQRLTANRPTRLS
jgi:hypothetical protein